MHTHVADDWFVGFHEGLKAKFWRAAAEPWADDEAAAMRGSIDATDLGERPGARLPGRPAG